uniref:Putative permease of the major facilitator superfamily protein n=2 Tax=Nyssomyia neivai TaxID=330878 RepID=A0A1L8DET6_9DIPT
MSTEKSPIRRVTDMISCRQVLNIMVILGFMLNYALRVNLTIAIVSMVSNTTTQVLNTTDNSTVAESAGQRFNWDSLQQNFVLGSFFWGYILTELPGGRLAELIGGRRVFGHSMLWASILTLITPFAAMLHYVALIIVRVLLGFFLGASWPAIHPMIAVWIKPMDRSKFMSNMMASSLGAAITMPICGFLIEYCGWASVFYATGGVGLLWSIMWFMTIYESPATHPRITAEERREIEEAIGSTTSKKRPSYVPWKQLLTSGPVWAIILVHGASVFGFFTVVNQLPTYMKNVLHFNIKENGLLSSLPYLGKYIMAVCASYLADYLRQANRLSTTAARKLFTTFAVLPPGLMMIAQIFMGHNRVFAVTIFTIQLTLNGAVTAGYLGNGLDIAPNFSGTIFGLANTLSSLSGFLSNFMVGWLTHKNQTYGQWQIVFGILAGVYIIGSLIYLLLGTGELQEWNNPPERKKKGEEDAEEGVPLKNNKIIS